MTTNNDPNTDPTNEPANEPTNEPTTDPDKEKNFRALEEARNKVQGRAQRLLDASVSNMAKSMGLPTDDEGNVTGIGKLLVKEYKSTLGEDDVPTDDHFKSFLTEQGYDVGAQRTNEEVNMANLQDRSDALRGSSAQPTPPSDVSDLIKQAEQEALQGKRNWGDVMDLKLTNQIQGS